MLESISPRSDIFDYIKPAKLHRRTFQPFSGTLRGSPICRNIFVISPFRLHLNRNQNTVSFFLELLQKSDFQSFHKFVTGEISMHSQT